ncbi:MAG: ATP-binding cassette domain-containing protein [Prevotellaceae bacterium]|jgi:ABC-2 type transport system ATP-binding protein|nr:ATP-binding cassette domain-containing protein [Prevotellaceae bacterium]
MNVLTLSGISKRYKSVTALSDVSFTVPEGSVFGILGPNGSGKTTLLGIVTDVLRASAGSYKFFDGSQPVNEIRKEMGVLLETPNFYPYLSARQNLEIVAKIKGCDYSNIDPTLKKVNLFDRRFSSFKTFSLGMKQRLAIASTLLNNPGIIILDEPTNGLDPEGISEIRQLIKQLSNEGKTVILASHLLDEVEKVCTHVAILKKGKLLVYGDVGGALSGESSGNESTLPAKQTVMIEVGSENMGTLTDVLKTLSGVLDINQSDNLVTISHYEGELTPEEVNKYCFEHGVVLNRLIAKNKNLESKFLEITK